MDPGDKIYTIDEFRCWKVENLDDHRSNENKNEGGGYRVVSNRNYSAILVTLQITSYALGE